ncbi:hypothetical protein [Streptomyces sp. NPDC088727]|uniref:hypothetical protein n=1 Tax=Streptomyces sp. NPDC088727 TaxID=3365875 RepID=UPI0038058321
MSTEACVSPWRIGNPSTPVVDITVPYANENRNHVLLREWRRQGVDLVPPPPVRLPRHSTDTYRARIWKQNFLDFFLEDQYSDSVAGSTGGPGGALEGRIVMSVTLSGEWRFATGGRRATVPAGTLSASERGPLGVRVRPRHAGDAWSSPRARSASRPTGSPQRRPRPRPGASRRP